MLEKQNVEIMLICKGWYNKNKYKDILEALNGYYHKYYGCEEIKMDKEFALHLFLKPLALESIKRDPKLATYIYESFYGFKKDGLFIDVLYGRTLDLIQMIKTGTFDISDYKNMLGERLDNDFEICDPTIGVI